MAESKIAVVTGGNRGIGFEVCHQLTKLGFLVILTARDAIKGLAAAKEIAKSTGIYVDFFKVDVTLQADIDGLKKHLISKYGRADVLINNAGILPDNPNPGIFSHPSIFETSIDVIDSAIRTNVYGSILMCQAVVPLMKSNNYGRIVNVSSTMGQLSTIDGGTPGYRISKVALNAVTRVVAGDLEGTNVLCNSVSPGWVRTAMGGAEANRSAEEGAKEIVSFATLPDGGPNGGFFRDGVQIEW